MTVVCKTSCTAFQKKKNKAKHAKKNQLKKEDESSGEKDEEY